MLALEGVVPEEWIDVTGHMNIMWYTALFDRACRTLVDRIGMPSLPGPAGAVTLVAARLTMFHRREMLRGDAFQLWSGFVRATPKVLTVTHRLMSADAIRAVCHVQLHGFDIVSRHPADLPQVAVARAAALTVPGMGDPFSPPG